MTLEQDASELLPEDVPVTMPELPATLRVHTAQQFKAVGDATRSLILHIIKHEPITASQIGARLNIPPGTVGHHLQVLEAAGLAQIVARRLVHGIVAKYYTRTARLFLFDFPPEIAPGAEGQLDFLTEARDQLADTLVAASHNSAPRSSAGAYPIWSTSSPPGRPMPMGRSMPSARRSSWHHPTYRAIVHLQLLLRKSSD